MTFVDDLFRPLAWNRKVAQSNLTCAQALLARSGLQSMRLAILGVLVSLMLGSGPATALTYKYEAEDGYFEYSCSVSEESFSGASNGQVLSYLGADGCYAHWNFVPGASFSQFVVRTVAPGVGQCVRWFVTLDPLNYGNLANYLESYTEEFCGPSDGTWVDLTLVECSVMTPCVFPFDNYRVAISNWGTYNSRMDYFGAIV